MPGALTTSTSRSLELTHVVVEDVGVVQKMGLDVLNTRKNRYLNVECGIVGKTVLTCNPTQGTAARVGDRLGQAA